MVDIRSDTVTKPSEGMREAIAAAEVGDDVFGEDPTVNRLQSMVAELLGKEAGLYVPSGTMANQVAINAHTQPGDEVICEAGCHLYNFESGAPALLSGIMVHPLHGDHGVFTAEQVAAAIRPPDHHFARTSLIAVENTHNRAGGTIFPLENMEAISGLAKERGLRMHLDGARLLNAVSVTGIPATEWTAFFDSVSICLSKGLGAPIGSVLTGSAEFIDLSHRYRKIYGGGMRQAGIAAAAGIYALENNIVRLVEDHDNALRLARGIMDLEGLSVEEAWVHTNICMIDIDPSLGTAAEWMEALGEEDVMILAIAPARLRAVMHLNVDSEDVDTAIAAFRNIHSHKSNSR